MRNTKGLKAKRKLPQMVIQIHTQKNKEHKGNYVIIKDRTNTYFFLINLKSSCVELCVFLTNFENMKSYFKL